MAKITRLDGPQKAAIFLMAMGDEFSQNIFRGLTEYEIKLLGKRMAGLDDVTIPSVTVQDIMDEFQKKSSEVSGITGKGMDHLKDALISALGDDKAKPIIESITQATDTAAFSSLRGVDPLLLVDYLKGEHPQTIALVLAHLDFTKAAQIIRELPEKLQPEIIYRMANLGIVPSGIIEDIDTLLKKEIEAMGSTESKKLGGIETVAEIMNQIDHTTENNIFASLEEMDADLAEGIRQKMFVFEDIVLLDDRAIQKVLREVDTGELAKALRGVEAEVQDKIFRNMSKRAAGMLKEEMEYMGPVRLKDVEETQQKIVSIIRKLEDQGEIVVARSGEDEMVV